VALGPHEVIEHQHPGRLAIRCTHAASTSAPALTPESPPGPGTVATADLFCIPGTRFVETTHPSYHVHARENIPPAARWAPTRPGHHGSLHARHGREEEGRAAAAETLDLCRGTGMRLHEIWATAALGEFELGLVEGYLTIGRHGDAQRVASWFLSATEAKGSRGHMPGRCAPRGYSPTKTVRLLPSSAR
jgi:hypothetical protein